MAILAVFAAPALGGAVPAPGTPLPGGASALREVYADWQVNCSSSKAGAACAMAQVQADPKTQRTLLVVEVTASGADAARGTLVMPFGLALSAGVSLSIDNGAKSSPLSFTTCLPSGCTVPFNLKPDMLKALRQGSTLHIEATVNDNGKFVQFSVPLSGFAAAFSRLTQISG